MQSVIA
jgi:hypothetical protein